jgi:phospholipase C
VAFTADNQWTNCSDVTQPGIAPIVNYLASLPWHPAPNCAAGRYYMINNLSPGTLPNGTIDVASIEAGSKVPPSSLRTIGDALNEKGISWAYYRSTLTKKSRAPFERSSNYSSERAAPTPWCGASRN